MNRILSIGVLAVLCACEQNANTAVASDEGRRKCAKAIVDAIAKTSSRDAAQAYVRSDPHSRSVCKEFEMNGVPIIP